MVIEKTPKLFIICVKCFGSVRNKQKTKTALLLIIGVVGANYRAES